MSIAWTVLDRKLPILLTDKLHDAESPQKSTCAAFMWSRRGLLTWNKTGMQPDLPRMSATPAALGSQFGQAVWASRVPGPMAAQTLQPIPCATWHAAMGILAATWCPAWRRITFMMFLPCPAGQDHNTRVMKLG